MPNEVNKFIILESVDSTNNYAMALVQKGDANSGDAVFALDQMAGKGRRGKQWESTKGENIILTVITGMEWLSVLNQFQVSVAVALAGYELISRYTTEEIKIKWPNDLFINDRKAGGILIENVIKGQLWQWSIIGIGINVNQEKFQDNIGRATSLNQVNGKLYDPVRLAKELHVIVLEKIEDLQKGHYKKMLATYNTRLFRRHEQVKLKKGPIVFETQIEAVSSSGELITNGAMEQAFKFDEVEWIF